MYTKNEADRTDLKGNKAYRGETIEQKVARIVHNREPIKDGAPLLYTDRKDGVLAGTNIRSDRFEIATDATDRLAAEKIAKREARVVTLPKKDDEAKPGGMDNKTDTPTQNEGK